VVIMPFARSSAIEPIQVLSDQLRLLCDLPTRRSR